MYQSGLQSLLGCDDTKPRAGKALLGRSSPGSSWCQCHTGVGRIPENTAPGLQRDPHPGKMLMGFHWARAPRPCHSTVTTSSTGIFKKLLADGECGSFQQQSPKLGRTYWGVLRLTCHCPGREQWHIFSSPPLPRSLCF